MTTPKKKKVTLADVAQEAGVSVATASRIIQSNFTTGRHKDAVQAAARALDYQCTPEYAEESRNTILVVMPELGNPFYAPIFQGISDSCSAHNYFCSIFIQPELNRSLNKFLKYLELSRPSGIILMTAVNTPEILEQIAERVPLVQCTEYCGESSLPFVSVDDYLACKSAVEHMIAGGKKRIAVLNGPTTFKYARERYRGYKDALTEAGLPIVPEYVVSLPVNYKIGLTVASQMLRLSKRPDAFLCSSDVFAAAVIRAANRLKIRVPDDVGVVGFDNTFVALLTTPALSTVHQPQYEMGYTSCEMLLSMISNPRNTSNIHVVLQTDLILRESL